MAQADQVVVAPSAAGSVYTVTLVGGVQMAFVGPTQYQILAPPLPPFLRIGSEVEFMDIPSASILFISIVPPTSGGS